MTHSFSTPSAPTLFKGDNLSQYPQLLSDSTNFRIKKIMDDEKLLQEEIKFRNSMCKKYGRMSIFADSIEYTLILADIILGTLATAFPVVGNMVSTATFSGVGLISGLAKLIQSKLNGKKLKHCKLSIIAQTTLANIHHKISKAIVDGQISHEEFEDIQNTINDWKKNPSFSTTKQPTLSQETIELLSQQATEKAQKDLLDQLKKISSKNVP